MFLLISMINMMMILNKNLWWMGKKITILKRFTIK